MLNAKGRSEEFFGKSKRSLPIREKSIASSHEIQTAGEFVLRYGLVLIPGMDREHKVHGVRGCCDSTPLVASSPLMSWMQGPVRLLYLTTLPHLLLPP